MRFFSRKENHPMSHIPVPVSNSSQENFFFKKQLHSLMILVVITIFFAIIGFFLALKPAEETMIPKVVGRDLATAILELQSKELIPRVQIKFSTDPREKGTVVAQDPQGGLLVKEGRQVLLWVSKGAIVDKVENYLGQNLSDVRLHLKSLFATQSQALIRIKEDPIYVYHQLPEGTILEQKPRPETPIVSTVDLELVVSRGPEGQMVKVGSYLELTYSQALVDLANSQMPFVFKARKSTSNESHGRVVSQNPISGAIVPKGTVIHLVMSEPIKTSENQVFGVFETSLPEYPILVDLKLELRNPYGESKTLIAMKHPGGLLAIPYLADEEDILVLSILDKELVKQKIVP